MLYGVPRPRCTAQPSLAGEERVVKRLVNIRIRMRVLPVTSDSQSHRILEIPLKLHSILMARLTTRSSRADVLQGCGCTLEGPWATLHRSALSHGGGARCQEVGENPDMNAVSPEFATVTGMLEIPLMLHATLIADLTTRSSRADVLQGCGCTLIL